MLKLTSVQINGKEVSVGVNTTDGSALYYNDRQGQTIQAPTIRTLIETLSLMDKNKVIELTNNFGG